MSGLAPLSMSQSFLQSFDIIILTFHLKRPPFISRASISKTSNVHRAYDEDAFCRMHAMAKRSKLVGPLAWDSGYLVGGLIASTRLTSWTPNPTTWGGCDPVTESQHLANQLSQRTRRGFLSAVLSTCTWAAREWHVLRILRTYRPGPAIV